MEIPPSPLVGGVFNPESNPVEGFASPRHAELASASTRGAKASHLSRGVAVMLNLFQHLPSR
jgi:hypothetical protein